MKTRIINIVNIINLLAVIMSALILAVLICVGIYEFVNTGHAFWFQMLPINCKILIGKTALTNLVYSFTLSMFKLLSNDTYKKNIKYPFILNVLSLFNFIIYLIYVVSVF